MNFWGQVQSIPTPVLFQIKIAGITMLSISSNGGVIVSAATDINFTYGFTVTDSGSGVAAVALNVANGSAALSLDYEVTTTLDYIGLEVVLPSAGVYQLTLYAPCLVVNGGGSTTNLLTQLYNQTLGAVVPDSERLMISYMTQDDVFAFPCIFTFIVTVAAATTVRVLAQETYADGGYGVIYGSGITTINWIKLQ